MAASVQNQAQTTAEQTDLGIGDFFNTLWEKLPYILAAFAVIFVSFLTAKIAKRTAERALARTGSHQGAVAVIGKTAYAICLIIGITIAFKIVGVDLSFIVGAATFGFGFAMQDVLENYVSGVLILFQQPFKPGDIIKTGDFFGRVELIETRTTFIRVFDGQRVIVPNSQLLSQTVINYSTYPERRVSIAIGVSYDSDLAQVIKIIKETIKSNPKALKHPGPMIAFNTFNASSIDLTAKFWIDTSSTNSITMTSDMIRSIKSALDQAGINIPYPVTTLSVNKHDSEDLYKVLVKDLPAEPPAAPPIKKEILEKETSANMPDSSKLPTATPAAQITTDNQKPFWEESAAKPA